jgi:hypothetical protein
MFLVVVYNGVIITRSLNSTKDLLGDNSSHANPTVETWYNKPHSDPIA